MFNVSWMNIAVPGVIIIAQSSRPTIILCNLFPYSYKSHNQPKLLFTIPFIYSVGMVIVIGRPVGVAIG